MNKPLDLTKPIQTRDGRPAKFLHNLATETSYPLVFVIGKPGEEKLERYAENGASCDMPYKSDFLINVPVKHVREYWVNLNVDGSCDFWSTRSLADAKHEPRLACKKITIEFFEGEGL